MLASSFKYFHSSGRQVHHIQIWLCVNHTDSIITIKETLPSIDFLCQEETFRSLPPYTHTHSNTTPKSNSHFMITCITSYTYFSRTDISSWFHTSLYTEGKTFGRVLGERSRTEGTTDPPGTPVPSCPPGCWTASSYCVVDTAWQQTDPFQLVKKVKKCLCHKIVISFCWLLA